MTRRPIVQTAATITPRQVRRYARRRGVSEVQAYAELFNRGSNATGGDYDKLLVTGRPIVTLPTEGVR